MTDYCLKLNNHDFSVEKKYDFIKAFAKIMGHLCIKQKSISGK